MQAGAISSLCCVPPSFSILDGCVFPLLKRDIYFINLTIICGRYILKDVLRLAPGLEVLQFTTIPHNFDLMSRMSIEE